MKLSVVGKFAGAVAAAAVFAVSSVQSFASTADTAKKSGDIVILHTNDVHCAVDATENSFGYVELAAYRTKLQEEGNTTLLADAGDAIQGGAIGTLSKGQYIIDIMNELKYDIAVPGNHEFDYGLDRFMELREKHAKFPFVASNFKDIKNNKLVLEPYKVLEANGKKIAFIGIATPETITKSTPKFFQDENGEYIYSFEAGNNGKDLYDSVQNSIDKAKAEKVDYIVALGHMGVDKQSEPWTSRDIIKNTSGIDVFLDGHSHTAINNEKVKDKSGKDVILSQTQTALAYIGEVRISPDGSISSKLVSPADYKVTDNKSSAEYKAYEAATAFMTNIKKGYEAKANQVVAKTSVDLTILDPTSGERIIRNRETNLGDLAADAYRDRLESDIGLVNGGGVRANIPKGDITYENILSVHPFGNMACLIEATGQQILDALEMGAMYVPEESGGFLHVSGLTYEIHTYIPSSVKLNDNREFVSVDGERRVKNVMVGDKPLDPNARYTVASHNYMLKMGGDGYTMFKGAKLLRDEVMLDNEVLISYIEEALNGVIGEEYSNLYGQNRISILSTAAEGSSQSAATSQSQSVAPSDSASQSMSQTGTEAPAQEPSNNMTIIYIIGGVVVLMVLAYFIAAAGKKK